MSQLFISAGQRIGASASLSVLPVNIQGWFPLGLTGLIPLQSKGLSRVERIESINSLVLSLLYDPVVTSICDYWNNHSFDQMELGMEQVKKLKEKYRFSWGM